MNNKTIIWTFVLMLSLSVLSSAQPSLENETIYCDRYNIGFWCDEGGTDFLSGLSPDVLAEANYINDYAFSDKVRYTGALRIIDIDVNADITRTSSTEATYTIHNPSSEAVNVHLVALETPESTELYVGGSRMDADPLLDGWDMQFSGGEQEEVRLVFREPLYGDIYAYNVNLLFDGKTIDNHITPTGNFKFTLPENADSPSCSPSSYTTGTEDGRKTVKWERTDFVPWTNPFNDLICSWDIGEANATETASEEAAPEGDSSIWLIILPLIILALAYLWRTGRIGKPIHD